MTLRLMTSPLMILVAVVTAGCSSAAATSDEQPNGDDASKNASSSSSSSGGSSGSSGSSGSNGRALAAGTDCVSRCNAAVGECAGLEDTFCENTCLYAAAQISCVEGYKCDPKRLKFCFENPPPTGAAIKEGASCKCSADSKATTGTFGLCRSCGDQSLACLADLKSGTGTCTDMCFESQAGESGCSTSKTCGASDKKKPSGEEWYSCQ